MPSQPWQKPVIGQIHTVTFLKNRASRILPCRRNSTGRGPATQKNAHDRRTVPIQTAAFGFTGWIDMTRIQPGDELEVQIKVTLAGHKSVLFAKAKFTSPDLLCMADFARGQNHISGNFIDLVWRQTKSGGKFKKPVEIAYRFVVEAQ
jgi:hypothetical protein